MNIIELNNIYEKYRIKFISQGKVSWEEIWALEDVSLGVNKGEVLGVIGNNGSGKTTLLKLIAGMLIPDKGRIKIDGKVSVLMELGAGFNPEFTGRENIALNAKVYGLDDNTLKKQMPKIIQFADLGRFIDAPIKHYSQGMYMRLAFALAIFVEPDILLLDDILAVGDEQARQNCIRKIFELKQIGKTIILVSHDMTMVNRLCDRVILLEKGKVIKDGLPQKIIQHYLETVGDKTGIAVLERGKLRLVFNNGRVSLSYDFNPLTKGIGAHTVFLSPYINSWVSSFNVSWQIKTLLDDKIIAHGQSEDGAFEQAWTLKLKDEGLEWKARIMGDSVKEAHIDLPLTQQFKMWLALEKEDIFPMFLHKYNWQNLGLNSFTEGFLAMAPQEDVQTIPGLILEIDNRDSDIRLFNSGYEQESRIIQTYFDKERAISINISIFPAREKFLEFVNNKRQQFILKQQAEQEKLILKQQGEAQGSSLERTISSGDIRLFVDVENKAIRIYHADQELTGGRGLYSSFKVSGNWLCSSSAFWQTQKISEKELIVTLDYKPHTLFQICKITFESQDSLKIKIELEGDRQIILTNQETIFELKDEYKKWLTAYEQGDFVVRQYINNNGLIRLKDNRIAKVALESDFSGQLPYLVLETTAQCEKSILGIYKHKEAKEENLRLNFSLLIPKKKQLIMPVKYPYFEGQISLAKNFVRQEESTERMAVKIDKDNLRIIFDRGRVKLFWKKKELTSGLSIYTSVRSQGTWYDSHQAEWELGAKDTNKITALGHWPYIPISQAWQMELIGEDTILWKVSMDIYEEVELEIEQANIMLSCEYKNWVVPGESSGKFTDEYTQDYDILPFRFWYGEPKEKMIAVIDKELSALFFKCSLGKNPFRAIAENSDYLYKARLIQYQRCNTVKLCPNKYDYFEGVIKIGSEGQLSKI